MKDSWILSLRYLAVTAYLAVECTQIMHPTLRHSKSFPRQLRGPIKLDITVWDLQCSSEDICSFSSGYLPCHHPRKLQKAAGQPMICTEEPVTVGGA